MRNILIFASLIIILFHCGKSELDRAREIYKASSSQISRRQSALNLQDAINILEIYLQKNPDNTNAKILLWKCYIKQDNSRADSLRKVLLHNSDNLSSHLLDHLNDNDEIVREKIVSLIGDLDEPKVAPKLIKILKNDKYQNVQQAAAEALAKMQIEDAVPVLMEKLNSSYPTVRYYAVKALGYFDSESVSQKLVRVLEDADERIDIRHQAALAIGKTGDCSVETNLVNIYQDSENSDETKLLAAMALGILDNPIGFDFALKKANSEDNYITCLSIQALGYIQNSEAVPLLIDYLKYGNKANRQLAAEALGRIRDKRAIPALKNATADPIVEVSNSAKKALEQINQAN